MNLRPTTSHPVTWAVWVLVWLWLLRLALGLVHGAWAPLTRSLKGI